VRKGRRQEGAALRELESLYRERLPHFRRVAVAIIGDPAEACDAVQEAFGLAVRRRSSFRRAGPLEAWVWRLVVNAARDHAHRRDLPVGTPAAEDHRSNGSDFAFPHEEVRVALAVLPERQRLVLFLRYYADLDYAAIAAALDIAPGTVAATLNAAHASLRRTLQEVPR
jgi:RNA polymerase sigma factor (sigma-70 family)